MKPPIKRAFIGLLLLTGLATPLQAKVFAKVLHHQGITFTVTSSNSRAFNSVNILATGLSEERRLIREKVNGDVMHAEVADLNRDGSPEIYIYAYDRQDHDGFLVAYSVNNRRSMSKIFLPEMSNREGYRGNDHFHIAGRSLVRSYPIHNDRGYSTGRTRNFYYDLQAGENGWRLVEDSVRVTGGGHVDVHEDHDVPIVRRRNSGEFEVLMPGGGVCLFSRDGDLIQKGATVDREEVIQAYHALITFKREQGF